MAYLCPAGEDNCIHDRCWKEWIHELEYGMDDKLTELLEDAFGAGYDHARTTVWGWTQAFQNFLSDFDGEIQEVRYELNGRPDA